MVMNKKGWIEIVEVFTAVLIILGFVLILLGGGEFVVKDIEEDVYDKENFMLRQIRLNDSIRGEILSLEDLPINSIENETFPNSIKVILNESKFSGFDCVAQVCLVEDECSLREFVEKEIYVQSGVIFSEDGVYNPRQIKIFCWED